MTNTINIISAVLLLISSILMVVVVSMQESRQTGMSGAISGGSSDSYLGKNRGRTKDAMLSRLTKVLATAFFVITLGVNIVASFL